MIRSPIKLLCFNILFLLLKTTFSLTDDFYQSDDHRAFISYHEPLLHMEEDSWGMIGASDSGESKEDTIVLSDQPIRLNESMKGYVEVEIETINSSLKLPRWQQQNAAINSLSIANPLNLPKIIYMKSLSVKAFHLFISRIRLELQRLNTCKRIHILILQLTSTN